MKIRDLMKKHLRRRTGINSEDAESSNLPNAASDAGHNVLQIFLERKVWKKLPIKFLEVLSERINNVELAKEFIILCEKSGMLKENIVSNVEGSDPEIDLGRVATTLTSYANAMGKELNLLESKKALELTLLIKPNHLPAWWSMAITAYLSRDCKSAVAWANKALNFSPNPNNEDIGEKGSAFYMSKEGEKVSSEAGFQGGDREEMRKLMEQIIRDCS